MAKMQIAERDRPRVKFECLRLMATLKLDRARMQLISGFVDSYLRLTTAEERRFQRQLQAAQGEEQEIVMQVVTSWMEEGLERGRQEGAESLVERQLRRRFTSLQPKTINRVRNLSEALLGDLGEALLDFKTLSDLDEWLEQHADA